MLTTTLRKPVQQYLQVRNSTAQLPPEIVRQLAQTAAWSMLITVLSEHGWAISGMPGGRLQATKEGRVLEPG